MSGKAARESKRIKAKHAAKTAAYKAWVLANISEIRAEMLRRSAEKWYPQLASGELVGRIAREHKPALDWLASR